MPRLLMTSACVCLIAFVSLSAIDRPAAAADSGAPTPSKNEPFIVRPVVTAKAFYVFRLNTQTGELFYEVQKDHKWVKTGEPADALPAGNYDLISHDDEATLYLFRVDRTSGKAWFLSVDKMLPIPEVDDAKKPTGSGFVFNLTAHATNKKAFWVYRSDPRTGATWTLLELKWNAVAE